MAERIAWIDTLRGIGIFLVVLGHFYTSGSAAIVYIYSFHVPLFFFLSGYLFNGNRYTEFHDFLINKIRTRLVPYLFFFFISYLIVVIRASALTGMNMPVVIAADNFRPMFFDKMALLIEANGQSLDAINNTALWFIPCLFITELCFFFCYKLTFGNKKMLAFMLLLSSVAGYIESVYGNKSMPWMLDTALTALVFYGIGWICRDVWKARRFPVFDNWQTPAVLFAVVTGICVAISRMNGRVDMNTNIYGNYFYFYAGALAGIFSFLVVAPLLPKQKLLPFLGRNSLIILGVHLPLFGPAIALLDKISELFVGKRTIIIQDDLYVFIIAGIILLFAVPIIYVINVFIPFVIGKKRAAVSKTAIALLP